MDVSDAEMHWVAGFLEGEGTFNCSHSPIVRADQVQREPLDRLQRIVGGGSIRLKLKSNPRHSDIHSWNLCGNPAILLMKRLYPYMSPKRQQQIKTAIETAMARPGGYRNNPKLSDDDVVKIRNDTRTLKEIATAYGISVTHAANVKNRRFRKGVPDPVTEA